jgi:rhodanese-related sulfurtransferase
MPIQQTTPPDAHRLMEQGHRYIDVRTVEEFATGHPAGAVNIPVAAPDPSTGQMAMNPDFLAVVEAHFPRGAQLILGCQSGMRSQRAAELLAQAGYTTVTNMQGGFGGARDQMGRTLTPGWSESGLPVCTNCAPENSYAGLRGKN